MTQDEVAPLMSDRSRSYRLRLAASEARHIALTGVLSLLAGSAVTAGLHWSFWLSLAVLAVVQAVETREAIQAAKLMQLSVCTDIVERHKRELGI